MSGTYMVINLTGRDSLRLELFPAAYGYLGSLTEQKIYYLVGWVNVLHLYATQFNTGCLLLHHIPLKGALRNQCNLQWL